MAELVNWEAVVKDIEQFTNVCVWQVDGFPAESWSLATLAPKFFMNISLDNMQQTLNLILFDACVVLVPSFQNVRKKKGKTKNFVVFWMQ